MVLSITVKMSCSCPQFNSWWQGRVYLKCKGLSGELLYHVINFNRKIKHLDTDNTVASTDPSGMMVWIDEPSNELWVDKVFAEGKVKKTVFNSSYDHLTSRSEICFSSSVLLCFDLNACVCVLLSSPFFISYHSLSTLDVFTAVNLISQYLSFRSMEEYDSTRRTWIKWDSMYLFRLSISKTFL